uniref:Uncharacterized protein n=1 Tax=Meloidogyne enterolobii TaxID=390850 RepID=A0A6V7UK06_MELEN|nr:unnamed protein product [Meloidogyne enterolobii]
MINELESHKEEISGEEFVNPFTPETSAPVFMGEQHQEKKKGKGIKGLFSWKKEKGSSSKHY